jgi:hypothetical protein
MSAFKYDRDDWYYLPWDSQDAMEVTEPRPGEGPDDWQARAPTWTYNCKEMTIPQWIAYRKIALCQIRQREKRREFIRLPPTDTPWPTPKDRIVPETLSNTRRWIHRRFLSKPV